MSLSGRHTSANDWMLMLGLYLVARAAGLGDGAVYEATGGVSGSALMHLLLAASAACIAYRASVVPGLLSARSSSLVESTQRRTSLNTSS